jgi:hypothetical protein
MKKGRKHRIIKSQLLTNIESEVTDQVHQNQVQELVVNVNTKLTTVVIAKIIIRKRELIKRSINTNKKRNTRNELIMNLFFIVKEFNELIHCHIRIFSM